MTIVDKISRNLYYYLFLKALELYNSRGSHIGRKQTVVLFSNPRGGSTWLAEVLVKSIPHTALVLEPLFRGPYSTEGVMPASHKAHVPTDKLAYWYYQPIPENDHWPESEAFFRKLLNREMLPLSIVYENAPFSLFSANTYVYKMCYGNLLLPWMATHFDAACVLLLRHPCAVIASQLRHENWQHVRDKSLYPFVLPEFRNAGFFKEYEDQLKTVRTPIENLAAMWAITVGHLVRHPQNDIGWITVAYEDLLLRPEDKLHHLFHRLGFDMPGDIMDQVRVPSKTTMPEDVRGFNLEGQLFKWKSQFTAQELKSIDRVLTDFNIDFYTTGAAEPDYSRIRAGVEQSSGTRAPSH